ncbi:DUF4164 family protein [Afifella pfennigii]|uniref:DUF4164 family protein n=1 Tax=Afifella pfennigii TaxID=209897 RepID=UPI0004790C7A|nr:DUF4164 family protein [Afifella pfennigii]
MHSGSEPGAGATRLAAAAKRLEEALGELELAVEQAETGEQRSQALSAQLHDLEQDRARLAEALDAASERSEKLEQARQEVGRRLERAIDVLQQALGEGDR